MGVYEYIKGEVTELTPASVVIDKEGIGYLVQISLQTYTALRGQKQIQVWIEEIIREDNHLLFGFVTPGEREIFRQLITVSGIWANTARMMLSSLTSSDLKQAVQTENVALLKSIKGIGLKTAQRVIIDLKDKIGKTTETGDFLPQAGNTARDEALSALIMLGFNKNNSAKVINQILNDQPGIEAENLVKLALKKL